MAPIIRTGRGGPGEGEAVGRRPPAGLALVVAAALLLWLLVSVPLAAGSETLYFRDVFGNHLPVKAFGAAALARGEVPAFNPWLGLGQPFRGNPSALAFYPGNLLYLALPLWSAFNLHFALHWLLAFAAMGVLARRLGMGGAAAVVAALAYAGSGYVLTCLSFYNLIAVAAWWPLAMAGAAAGGRRGIAWGGAACGMALLAGEPLTAALALLPLALVAVERHGGWRGATTAAAIGLGGLVVSAPQWVATLRVLGFTFRGAHGAALEQVESFALSPLRFVELVVPLPWGWPLAMGARGWWAWGGGGQMGYFLSLHAGIVALWLAAGAARRRPAWALVAAAGLLAAWLGGGAGPLLAALSGGAFRFPERFLVWWALALPLLAGWGLEAALARPAPRRRAAWWGAGALGAGAAALVLARPSILAAARGVEVPGPLDLGEVLAAQTLLWPAALAIGAALLAAAGWVLGARDSARHGGTAGAEAEGGPTGGAGAPRTGTEAGEGERGHAADGAPRLAAIEGSEIGGGAEDRDTARSARPVRAASRRLPPAHHRAAALAGLQLAALLPLAPLVDTVPTAPFRRPPPWLDLVPPGAAVFRTLDPRPAWEPTPPFRVPPGSRGQVDRRDALDLAAVPGVLHGLTYPLWPDIEGLSTPLHTYLTVELARAPWPARAAWLRALGVDAVVAHRPPPAPGLAAVARARRHGADSWLWAVERPAPDAWWPARVETAPGPQAALGQVAALADPVATVVAARPVAHAPGAAVRLVESAADRLVVDVAGGGGLLVVRRAWHPLLRARAGGRPLATQPAQLSLLGVEVPPGERRVVVDVDSTPEAVAGGAALLGLAALVALGTWRRRRRVGTGSGR